MAQEMKKPTPTDGSGEWDESDHPRDSDGKFSENSGGAHEVTNELTNARGKLVSAIKAVAVKKNKDKKVVIITPELRGGHLTYLFTAYKTRKAPS